MFKFDFRHCAQLVEKDSIFVPIGWDTMAKIKLDFDNQKVNKQTNEPASYIADVCNRYAKTRMSRLRI
jgi:hypothetical protein